MYHGYRCTVYILLNISYTFKHILAIHSNICYILYISVYTHNSSELVPVSFSRDFVDPIGLQIWKFPTLSAFLSFCFFLWHCWPPILQGLMSSCWQVELRMTSFPRDFTLPSGNS